MTPDRNLAATTLRQVADLAEVSTATVARVLQGSARVSEGTRARVQAVLEATGYRHNAVASGLRRQRTSTIGHILHATSPNPFYAGVALGLQQEAALHGYQVLLANSQDAASEAAAVEAFLARRVDALVFTTAVNAQNVATAVQAGVPVVQVERRISPDAETVVVDNTVGSRAATQHLVDLGHEQIAFIGARPAGTAIGPTVEDERLEGYLAVMADAGLEPRELLGEHDDQAGGVGYRALGRTYLRKLLEDGPVPTAVFAASDTLAAGVLQALYELDLRVPQDMSVVGFDDTVAAHLCPPLSTVALPTQELGRRALRRAVGDPGGSADPLVAQFVLRGSTARPRRS